VRALGDGPPTPVEEVEPGERPSSPAFRPPEPFEVFYEREYHSVVAFAYALSGSWWVAEDLAQEAFLAAHRRWERVGLLERPGAWVRRALTNLAASAVRRRFSEARALLRLTSRREPPEPLPDDEVDFLRAVRSLPRRQAQAVALFYLEDWPTAQIAEALGCSDATVRVHLHNGRRALARRLGQHDGRAAR
jgi:RNA polymerase sigma-70 factor (ECF subfamily)